MARAAVKAKQQQRAKAQPARAARGRRRRGSGGGNPNQQLFFMRLRRQAKWAYVVLAVLFAATFIGVGVGSGSNGLSGLFDGIFGSTSSGPSIAKAQAEIKKDPVKGWHELAQAYQAKGQTANAIPAYQRYLTLKKQDASAWTQLGSLQLTQGLKYYNRYQQEHQRAQLSNPGQAFLPAGPLGQALATNPIQQLDSQKSSALLTRYSQQSTSEYDAALQSYKTAARLRPHDAQAQYYIAQAAQAVGSYPEELTALKTYLKLSPNSPQKSQIQSVIKQLEKATAKKK